MAYTFSKSWMNPSDFPTIETDELKVRADMQYFPDKLLEMINAVASGTGLADGAVDTAQLHDNAVVTSKIQDGSITDEKLAISSIPFNKLQDAQKHVRKLVVTVPSNRWTEYTDTVDGSTAKCWFTKFTVDSDVWSDMILEASIVISPYAGVSSMTSSQIAANLSACLPGQVRNYGMTYRLVGGYDSSNPDDPEGSKVVVLMAYSTEATPKILSQEVKLQVVVMPRTDRDDYTAHS